MKHMMLGLFLWGACVVDGRALHAQSTSPLKFLGVRSHVMGKQDFQVFMKRIANCRSDPSSCSDVIDDNSKQADEMQDNVIEDMNDTADEFRNFSFEVEDCNSQLGDVSSYRTDFDQKVSSHTECRKQQSELTIQIETCEQLQESNQKLRDAECNNEKLVEPVDDLVDICKPTSQQPLGQWLESMAETFAAKYAEWQTQSGKCTSATWELGNSTEHCDEVKKNVSNHASICDQELDAIESFACSWASQSGARCFAYEQCYDSVVNRYNSKVAEVQDAVKQWKETWIAAAKMKCMSDAIGVDGKVDSAKMANCSDSNNAIYDTSHISVDIPQLPAQAQCVQPEIYPGSQMYHDKVYDGLPSGIAVREPTLCLSWKGGCAGHSTFADHSVYLLHNSKYCRLVGEVIRCDGDAPSQKFKFTHSGGSCVGQVVLSAEGSQASCRYDPQYSGSEIGVKCSTKAPQGCSIQEWASVNSNPLATGSRGQVSLTFARMENLRFNRHSMTDWNEYDQRSYKVCNEDGSGGFDYMISEHSNDREDRRFKYRCKYSPSGFDKFQMVGWSSWTTYDGEFRFECANNQVLGAIDSYHSNGAEDRKFQFRCATLPDWVTPNKGSWLGWVNDWDRPAGMNCENGFLSGIHSYHSNDKEDRRWEFKCTAVTPRSPPTLDLAVQYAF